MQLRYPHSHNPTSMPSHPIPSSHPRWEAEKLGSYLDHGGGNYWYQVHPLYQGSSILLISVRPALTQVRCDCGYILREWPERLTPEQVLAILDYVVIGEGGEE